VDSTYKTNIGALALVSHELRTPASIMSGYLRLLQQDSDGFTPRQRRMMDEAGRACGRVLALLQEISEFATLEGSDPAAASMSVPVFAVCDEAMKAAAVKTGAEPAVFTMDPGDRSAVVDGNPAWLKRAFGALIAAAAREYSTEPFECHGFISDASGGRHAVMLCGPRGVSANREDLIARRGEFDRWRGGTGLSLPIACRIIEAHGGSVWSPGGADSRASIWNLPIASSRALS
jgi:signal transduction histidine kinase